MPPDSPKRFVWAERFAVGLACLLLAVLFGYPVLADLKALGSSGDWDQHLLYHWAPYVSVRDYGEFPLWNPWACGGTPLLANPQARFLSPLFLLHLATGPVPALHLEILLHLALGAGGGWFLGQALGLRRLGRAAVAFVFLGTSAHYLHLAMGHTWFLSYAYVPWIVGLVWRALETRRLAPALGAGALLALVVLEGGIYPAPQVALLLTLLCVGLAMRRRERFPLEALAATGLSAIGFAAPKLLPTLELMWQHPRKTEALESTGFGLLFDALFSRDQTIGRAVPAQEGLTWGFHEYGAYLGPAAAILVLAALLLARRRGLAFALLASVFLLLAVGRAGGLWPALHALPPFSSQHVPSRFLVPFLLCAAVLAGIGAEAFVERWGRAGALAAVLLLVAGTADAWRIGPPNLWRLYDAPQGPAGPPGPFHHEHWGDSNLMMPLALANRGALHCYESVYLQIAAKMPGEGFRGEQYLTDGGEVRLVRWGPNALDFETRAGDATVLVVNQNFDPGWTLVEPKGRTFSRDGVLAAELPANVTRVSLRYRSRALLAGAGVALATLVAALWLCLRERRRGATDA